MALQTPASTWADPWVKMQQHIRIGLKIAIRSSFVVGNSSGRTINPMDFGQWTETLRHLLMALELKTSDLTKTDPWASEPKPVE